MTTTEKIEAFWNDYLLTLPAGERDQKSWEYYSEECKSLGKIAALDMPMICQVFKLIYKG